MKIIDIRNKYDEYRKYKDNRKIRIIEGNNLIIYEYKDTIKDKNHSLGNNYSNNPELIFKKFDKQKENEDSVFSATNGDLVIATVCDGLGSTGGYGKIAARIVTKTIEEVLWKDLQDNMHIFEKDDKTVEKFLSEAIHKFDIKLFKKIRSEAIRLENDGLETTLTLVINYKDKIYYESVGDSRIYIMKNGHYYTITKDDVILEIKDKKLLNEKYYEIYHLISKGMNKTINPYTKEPSKDSFNLKLKKYNGIWEAFLLCSDGFYELRNNITPLHYGVEWTKNLIVSNTIKQYFDNIDHMVNDYSYIKKKKDYQNNMIDDTSFIIGIKYKQFPVSPLISNYFKKHYHPIFWNFVNNWKIKDLYAPYLKIFRNSRGNIIELYDEYNKLRSLKWEEILNMNKLLYSIGSTDKLTNKTNLKISMYHTSYPPEHLTLELNKHNEILGYKIKNKILNNKIKIEMDKNTYLWKFKGFSENTKAFNNNKILFNIHSAGIFLDKIGSEELSDKKYSIVQNIINIKPKFGIINKYMGLPEYKYQSIKKEFHTFLTSNALDNVLQIKWSDEYIPKQYFKINNISGVNFTFELIEYIDTQGLYILTPTTINNNIVLFIVLIRVDG